MLDAYTIRKIVPRLVFAVIGVNLSIYLCIAAVDITNIVGHGLGDLLRAPFVQSQSFNNLHVAGNAPNDIVGVVGAGALGAIVAVVLHLGLASDFIVVALGMLLLAALVVVLVAIAILATLVIRYGALILLSIVSPVAIACTVLPGTEKYFRQWWDLFLKTLIVFPIIAAIFAVSDILGAILLSTQDTTNGLNSLVSVFVVLVAMYAPLFMIPFSFKMAGGFLGNVYGFMQDRGVKPIQDKLNKWKEDPESWYAGNKRRLQQNRYDRGLTGKQVASGAVAGGRAFLGGEGRAGFRAAYGGTKRRIAAQKNLAAQKEAQEREAWAAVVGDNDVAKALQMGGSRQEIMANLQKLEPGRFGRPGENDPNKRRALEEYTSLIQSLQGSMGQGLRDYAAGEEYAKGTTSFKVGDRGIPIGLLENTMQAEETSSVLGTRAYLGQKSASKDQAHRLDIAGHSSSVGILKRQEWIATRGTDKEDVADAEYEQWALDSSWKKNAPTAHANADHNGTPRMMEHLVDAVQKADAMPVDTPEQKADRRAAMEKTITDLNALLETTNYMPPENRDDYRQLFKAAVEGEKRLMPVLDDEGNEVYERDADDKVIMEDIKDSLGKKVGQRPKVLERERPLSVKELVTLMTSNPGKFRDVASSARLFGASEFDQRHRAEEAMKPPDA